MSSKFTYRSLMIASIVCAVVVGVLVGMSHPLVPLPDDLLGVTQPTAEQLERMLGLQRHNDTIALTMFGTMAMAAGVPVFARSSSLVNSVVYVVVALGIGAAAGWLMGKNGFYCQDWLPITWDVLVRVTVRWMAMLLPFGVMAALLTALTTREFKQTGALVVGGVIGCLVASVAYALITAVIFPGENSDSVLPNSAYSRLVLFGLSPLLVWTAIAYQCNSSPRGAEAKSPVELEVA